MLIQGHRDSEPLLCYVRQFYDGIDEVVTSLAKDPTKVTGAHIQIVGHCSPEELNLHLTDNDKTNGTANRFLFIWGVCGPLLKLPSQLYKLLAGMLANDVEELKGTIRFASEVDEVARGPEAQACWDVLYPRLRRTPPGRLGVFFRRAPTFVARIAALFALGDRKREVELVHLDAAVAIWEHSARTLRYLFKADRDPDSEKLVEALEAAPNGLTKSQIFDLWSNKRSSEWLKEFLNKHLTDRTIVKKKDKPKAGRPAERFFLRQW